MNTFSVSGIMDKVDVVLNVGEPTWFQFSQAGKSCTDIIFTSVELGLVGEGI